MNVNGSCFNYSAPDKIRELHAMQIMFAKPLQDARTGVNLNLQKGGEITLNSEQGLFSFKTYVIWCYECCSLKNEEITPY